MRLPSRFMKIFDGNKRFKILIVYIKYIIFSPRVYIITTRGYIIIYIYTFSLKYRCVCIYDVYTTSGGVFRVKYTVLCILKFASITGAQRNVVELLIARVSFCERSEGRTETDWTSASPVHRADNLLTLYTAITIPMFTHLLYYRTRRLIYIRGNGDHRHPRLR